MQEDDATIKQQQLYDPYSKLFECKIQKFPGALPVALTRDQLTLLHYGYVVATKADGERVFVIVVKNKMILHRRDDSILTYELQDDSNYASYIFDAEYIPQLDLLLLFDTLVFQNVPAILLSIEQRVELINMFLNKVVPVSEQHMFKHCFLTCCEPLPTQYRWGTTWYPKKCIKLQAKPIYCIQDASTLWKNHMHLPYESDGLIFTRILCAYTPYTQNKESILKWKPTTTIDFKVCKLKNTYSVQNETLGLIEDCGYLSREKDFEFFLDPKNQRHANYALLSVHNNDSVRVSCCVLDTGVEDGCVAEFSWDDKHKRWQLRNMRPDKQHPNSFVTVLSSFVSLLDNIQVEEI